MKIPPFAPLLLGTLLLACGAQVSDGVGQSQGAATTASAPTTSAPAAPAARAASPEDDRGGCTSSGAHSFGGNGDGGAPGSLVAQCASVEIDGKTCTVSAKDVALDLGLDGHGWTLSANVEGCFGGAILNVSGVDDASYPQTAVQPFLAEASAWLATNEDATDDAGAGGGAFSTNPSGTSRLDDGPRASGNDVTVGVVRGKASLVGAAGKRREVTFDFAF